MNHRRTGGRTPNSVSSASSAPETPNTHATNDGWLLLIRIMNDQIVKRGNETGKTLFFLLSSKRGYECIYIGTYVCIYIHKQGILIRNFAETE